MQSNEQRSNEWFNERLGRFTASTIDDILGIKGLGLTGEALCLKKAREIVFGIDPDEGFTSFDMQRGIDLEPIAFETFAKLKDLEFLEVKKSYFFPYTSDAGASPDGLVGEDAILEIKCPKPDKLFGLITHGAAKIDKGYYSQMQMQMLCSNSQRCHFFNYAIFKSESIYHEIIVERDEKHIDFIKERLTVAVELRNEYVEKMVKNKQF